MAASFLARRSAFAACLLLVLSGCGFFSTYPTKDPKEVGDKVERLRNEVAGGLTIRPVETRTAFYAVCGEDWDDKKTVAPEENDPYRVSSNQFKFEAGYTLKINSGMDAPPVYTTLLRYLQKSSGWTAGELRSKNNFLGGVRGEKDGVRLYAYHSPDGEGRTNVYVKLETDCYRHPNA